MLSKRLISLPNTTSATTSIKRYTTVITNTPNFKLPALPSTDKVPTRLLTPYDKNGEFFNINNNDKEAKYLIKNLFPLYTKAYYNSNQQTETLTDLTWFPEEFKLTDSDIKSINQILDKLGSNNSQELYNELKLNYGSLENFGLIINYTIFHFNDLNLTTELISFYLGDGQNSEIGFNLNVNSFLFGKWLKYYVKIEEFDKALAIHEAALHFDIPQTPLHTKYLALALAKGGKLDETWELLRQLEQANYELSQSYYLTLFEHSNAYNETKFSVYIWKKMLQKFKLTNPQAKDQLSSKAYQLRLDNLVSFEELETLMKWITYRNLWQKDEDLKLKFLSTFKKFCQQRAKAKGDQIEPINLKYEFTKFNSEASPIYLLNGWLNYHLQNQLPSDKFKFIEFLTILIEISNITKSNAFLISVINNNFDKLLELNSEEQSSIVLETLKSLKLNSNYYHSGWLIKYKELLEKFRDLELEEELKFKVELLIKQQTN